MYFCRRLSDTDKDNALSETEFCIAMKLVLMKRKGFDIPTVLPDSLLQQQEQSELLATLSLKTNSNFAYPFQRLLRSSMGLQ